MRRKKGGKREEKGAKKGGQNGPQIRKRIQKTRPEKRGVFSCSDQRPGGMRGLQGRIKGGVISHYCRSLPRFMQDLDRAPKTNRNVAKARAKVGKECGRDGVKEGWQRDGQELGRSRARGGQSWTGIRHAVPWQARGGG